MIKLTIAGPIPPKKNSKQIYRNRKNGAPIIVSSNRYKEWHEMAMWELMQQKPPTGIERCTITYQFYSPTKRRKDASNLIESINDLLVDAGVLKDDNWFVIKSFEVKPVIVEQEGFDGVKLEINVL